MRLGSKNPTDTRASDDLGRFGLGLKSASFSQCRSLTVLSVKDSEEASCARWDLDRVSQRNDWSLELLDNHSDIPGAEFLPDHGTIVVWQKLDRLIGGYGEDRAKRISHLNEEIRMAERHLRLVFHRFLAGRNPQINLFLNGRKLKPIDPMASAHLSTQKTPEEAITLNKGTIKVRCYTLPHHKKMTQEEWDELGGTEGHLKSQGLYIYRENRLIISGGWLGLTRQTELTKLCRIAVDIPNTMDSEWKIDVKKASAQLPPQVRDRLKKVVEHFVGTSKQTYKRRGQKLVDEAKHPLWNRIQKDGQVYFRPNSDHPVFKEYANLLPDHLTDGFYRCIKIIGSGLPLETLHAELVGNAEAVVADHADEEELRQLVFAMADALLGSGVSIVGISDAMHSHPVLRDNWHETKKIIQDYLNKTGLSETRS